MDSAELNALFEGLATPLLADACLRCGVPLRAAAPGLRPAGDICRLAGRVVPSRHYGSVDIFLEAMATAGRGDVLVIDNGGRTDESCVGDLTALEARASGLAALLVWGCHRDTAELRQIGFPVLSFGVTPAGPQRLDAREPEALAVARFGGFSVTALDAVFIDADGALFVPQDSVGQVLLAAREIGRKERDQAQELRAGVTLRKQLRFAEYLERRARDPSYTFRRHLRGIGGAIEE